MAALGENGSASHFFKLPGGLYHRWFLPYGPGCRHFSQKGRFAYRDMPERVIWVFANQVDRQAEVRFQIENLKQLLG